MKRGVHRLAVVTALATLVLILFGGLVTNTGAALAVPDWPTTFGHNMFLYPWSQMVGGIFYEHSHRLFATGVGVLTIVLAVLLWRGGRRGLAVLAVSTIILQGVLGGLTVLLKLPPAVSMAHLALSMAFFVYLIALAAPPPVPTTSGLHRALVVAAALVYLQIVLGALVRHTHSALACTTEIPFCFGQLWPSAAPFQSQVHMAHRIFGVLVALAISPIGVFAARRLGGILRLAALAVPILVVIQVAIGVWTVLTLKALVPVELHLAVGALLLGCTSLLAIATRAAEAALPERAARAPLVAAS